MKKTVSLILALLMCFTMAVTGMADYSAGTYTGTAAGRNGDITVEVILSDDAIESVTVTAHQETPGISDAALVSVPAAIVEKQSLAVDTVAGATITSAAIIDAVEAALISAGVDVEALKTAETADTVEADLVVSDETYDIIVIGGGPAGLMASVTASEKGARVLLLEKMPYVGGNMLISGGCIQAADTSVQRAYGIVGDTVEQYMEEDRDPESPYATDDPAFTRTMYRGCSDMIEELVGRGLEFVDYDPVMRYHVIGPAMFYGGNTLAQMLKDQAVAAGAVFKLNTRATGLVTDEAGSVTGVIVDDNGHPVQYNASAVIVATGGFSSNNELISTYYPEYHLLPSSASVGTTGDGFIMATAVGAATRGMDTDQQMFFVSADTNIGIPMLLMSCNAILVNQSGDRFVNEDLDDYAAAHVTAYQEGSIGYMILSEEIRRALPEIQDYIDQGAVVEASSIDELAEKIGTENLAATLAHYNEMAAAGSDADFGRTFNFSELTSSGNWYAIKVIPAVFNSFGGIAIDLDTHVLREDGSVIGGLYAAGEVTGSVEVWEGYYYTTGIGQALVYGKIAANTAVDEIGR
ncbi:MAG: FAD-dependent oxidoreductase [Clostridia bacterium]|nr:FAD-dependent oxidoreductase [Clostridia bacterium]